MQSGMHCVDGVQLSLDSPALAPHCAHGTVGLLRKDLSNTNSIKLNTRQHKLNHTLSCFRQFCNSNCIFKSIHSKTLFLLLLHTRRDRDSCVSVFSKYLRFSNSTRYSELLCSCKSNIVLREDRFKP